MSKRYDICTPRKGKDDKTFWTRIGTAWEGEKGIQLVFDALPLPDSDGRCVANLFEPREKTQSYNGDPATNRSGLTQRQPAHAGIGPQDDVDF